MPKDSDYDIPAPSTPSHSADGMVFGGLAGFPLGSLAAVACYWILDAVPFEDAAIFGGLIGSLVGATIGKIARRKMGASTESNIATYIGVLYGLIPGCLIILGGIGIVGGKGSGLLLIAGFFIFPMGGMVIGGMLDRMYEAFLNSRIATWEEDERDRY